MARKKVFGNCRICGIYTKLSFEHVPPEAAFNNHRVVGKHIFELINKDPDYYFDGKGHISQRGAGAYTLCEKCNNDTGAWYGDAFANFAHQSLYILKHAKGRPSLYYPFRIYPLRVIKQIITMFFSINKDQFRFSHPDLVKFVLNKNERYLSPDIRILVYFTLGPHARYVGGTSISAIEVNPDEISRDMLDDMLNQYQRDYPKSLYSSEIAFPPLGYVLSFGLEPLDNELTDISFFARYPYGDWTSLHLKLPVNPVNTWYPGDYRSKEQIRNNFEENTQIEKEIQKRKQAEKNQ
ncbi:hypothetical protein C6501_08165 [Candidatus Poribacteria bacterium]|nr:MAG: hypothetical protein C6501_08165 [Candidatus Poribacteria bacterium]